MVSSGGRVGQPSCVSFTCDTARKRLRDWATDREGTTATEASKVDEAQEEWPLTGDGEGVAAADEPVEVFARKCHSDDPPGDSARARARA